MTNILAERAMLATLTIAIPSGRRIDKNESVTVTESNGAENGIARVWVDTMPKEALADLKRIAGQARTWHYSRTTPWLDSGPRLLSSIGYPDHSRQLRILGESFEEAQIAFLDSLPNWIDLAERKLGRLFRPHDAPTREDLSRSFEFRTRYFPVPDSGDFRVELADAQADLVRADMEESIKEAIRVAQADAWQRVAERVKHMVSKLEAYAPATEPGKMPSGIFRDSLVENIRELVELLPSLNVTGDPDLDKVADRMRADLCQHDAIELRESEDLRRNVAKSASAILTEVADYL